MSKHIFIHERAHVEGDVTLGDNVSVWPGAIMRGDEGEITIGDNTNVQDGVIIHSTTHIGSNVTIGHAAVVHGAKVGNNVLIGINSTILDGVEIGEWCIIAAGAVIPPTTTIPAGSMVQGIPGKVTRQLTDADKAYISNAWANYVRKIKK